jgi:hypothetical protein
MAALHGRKDQPEAAAPGSNDAQVVEVLRALIRREMGRPAEKTPPSVEPSLKEGMWLLLFCLNIVLLISRLPREVLSGPAVETAGKLLPAILGSLFVIYLAWFRERLVALTRHRRFHYSQVGLLFVLAFTSVPLFPVRPEILPRGTALSIDGKAYKNPDRIWLSFGAHDIFLQPARNAGAEPRQFRFSVRSLLRAVWNPAPGPDWNLLYPVAFQARDSTAKVEVKKLRGEYYDDVFEGTDLDRRDNAVLVLSMNENRVRTIRLPLGTYLQQWVLSTGETCRACQLAVTGRDQSVAVLEDACPGH